MVSLSERPVPQGTAAFSPALQCWVPRPNRKFQSRQGRLHPILHPVASATTELQPSTLVLGKMSPKINKSHQGRLISPAPLFPTQLSLGTPPTQTSACSAARNMKHPPLSNGTTSTTAAP